MKKNAVYYIYIFFNTKLSIRLWVYSLSHFVYPCEFSISSYKTYRNMPIFTPELERTGSSSFRSE